MNTTLSITNTSSFHRSSICIWISKREPTITEITSWLCGPILDAALTLVLNQRRQCRKKANLLKIFILEPSSPSGAQVFTFLFNVYDLGPLRPSAKTDIEGSLTSKSINITSCSPLFISYSNSYIVLLY